MSASKTQIDKSGKFLSVQSDKSINSYDEMVSIFDEYRKSHLDPLSALTIELQQWLTNYGTSYYIAQRLKRKPQILRKLRRLDARLTQLQDIGGCRIIVKSNADVDKLLAYIRERICAQADSRIKWERDYREKGRDDSGYRAIHLIIEKCGRTLELQVRSMIQHHWAESIERTSVVYGRHLKEGEGDSRVIDYFKVLSDVFYEVEAGLTIDNLRRLNLEKLRIQAEDCIRQSDSKGVIDSYVNESIIKTLIEKEIRNRGGLNNWIIIFDWNSGAFVSWDVVSRSAEEATRQYVEYEDQYPAEDGFEVVMIGSSDVATVRQTHSHYFGIDSSVTLEGLEQSVIGFSRRFDLDIGARQILSCLYRRKYWAKAKTITIETLRNHFCQGVITFDASMQELIDKELVQRDTPQSPIYLNIRKKTEIEACVN